MRKILLMLAIATLVFVQALPYAAHVKASDRQQPMGGAGPVIEVSPAALELSLLEGDASFDQLTISNLGGGSLDWTIEFDADPVTVNAHDPLLDEPLAIPNFTVVSPANGGEPQVFTIPAGVLTEGNVVGFSFQGTVAGITGNSTWASDLCLQIEGPDGSSFSVGGSSGTIPNCNVSPWAFQGSVSNNDGTYSSAHDDIWPFPPGAQDLGDWTFTFIHGWDIASASAMDWSGVSITLHKRPDPEICEFPAGVAWLSADPVAGSTLSGAPSAVEVMVDAAALAPGFYEASVCVASNDTLGNPLVVVPVALTVLPPTPEIDVSPVLLAANAFEGDSTDLTLSIGNLGTGELIWSIDEAAARVADSRAHFPRVPREVRASGGVGSALAEPADHALLAKLALDAGRAQAVMPLGGGGPDPVPAFTTTGFSRSDYVSLDALAPATLNTIIDPQTGTMFAQTFIDDDFSQQFFIATGGSVLTQNAYGFVDTSTGAVNQLGTLSGVPASGTWTSAAWDPSSGTVYAVIRPSGSDNQLFEIDVVSGTGTLVGTVSGIDPGGIVIAIAIDVNGLMYGMEITADVLIALDKTDATAAVIGPVGVNANFAQDMDFDRSTGTLYWASYLGGGNSNIRVVDTNTGATAVVGPVESGAELLSFSIAVARRSCDVPEDIAWLSLDLGAGSILPGEPAQSVLVTMDAASLDDGVYNALLCVNSNDGVTPRVEIPVSFEVLAQVDADLAVALGAEFGATLPGGQLQLALDLSNNGPAQASAAVVEVDLPEGFSLLAVPAPVGDGSWDCELVGDKVTCTLTGGVISIGASVVSFAFALQAGASASPGSFPITARVLSALDPAPGNDAVTLNLEVLAEGLFADGFEAAP